MEDKIMDINRETAMSLWNKRYGKATRITDFAGREIDKGAYDNRNSDYCWNLDHIYPVSLGGKTTESNLVICHIKTNDEKANKFPCFTANGKVFEIIKVENHYEIHEKETTNNVEEVSKDINFFDHSAGINFFKSKMKKDYFVGTIRIELRYVKEPAILDFIGEVFKDCNISYGKNDQLFDGVNYSINIKAYDLKTRDSISELLDNCVLLKTYLESYFLRLNYLERFNIIFIVECLHDLSEIENYQIGSIHNCFNNNLFINNLVKINTEANKKEIKESRSCGFYDINRKYNYLYEYDYYYIKLRENLERLGK